MSESSPIRNFVVASPTRWVNEYYARALESGDRLRQYLLGTRRGTTGVAVSRTRLRPIFGLISYAGAKTLSPYRAEALRYALYPWFDRWAATQIQAGDRVVSTYGCVNKCFKTARARGGLAFLEAGNSHPANSMKILREEHRIHGCRVPPMHPRHTRRAMESLEHVDYVLSPSSFVTRSFLDNGFSRDRVLQNAFPVDLSVFQPAEAPRPRERPLRIISTGMLSLRKGAPYLLEALRQVSRKHPSAKFLLTDSVQDNARPIVARYRDLPIDWAPPLPHDRLAERYRSADIFVLPSLEEGMVRTALEALACGLPVILTPNTGADDFVKSGVNGEVVPIRDARAISEAILKWADIVMTSREPPDLKFDPEQLSARRFNSNLLRQLGNLGV